MPRQATSPLVFAQLQPLSLHPRTLKVYASVITRAQAAEVLGDAVAFDTWVATLALSPASAHVYRSAHRAWIASTTGRVAPAAAVQPFERYRAERIEAGAPSGAIEANVRALRRAVQHAGLDPKAVTDTGHVRAVWAKLTPGRQQGDFRTAWQDLRTWAAGYGHTLPPLDALDEIPGPVLAAYFRLAHARGITGDEWQQLQWRHVVQRKGAGVAIEQLASGRRGTQHHPLTRGLHSDLEVIRQWRQPTDGTDLILAMPGSNRPLDAAMLRAMRSRGKTIATAEAAQRPTTGRRAKITAHKEEGDQ